MLTPLPLRCCFFVVALLGALALTPTVATAAGETITVTLALDDFEDFGGAQMVADLPGPDGQVTFREAVTAANNTPGPQTIAFAIPLSEWSIWATDRAIIEIDLMLYVSSDDTTIDFTTQVALTGDTNPNGNEVGIAYWGVPAAIPCIWLAGNRCVVKGLDIAFGNNFSNTIWITGNFNRVIGCTTNALTIRGDYGGGDFNIIGGTEPGEGNSFSEGVGIYSAASNNLVVGNIFRWGLRITGDSFWGTCDNNRVGGPTVAERNNLAGHGLYGEEGFPGGGQLEVSYAVNTIVENNYVGTTPDGSAKLKGRSGTSGIAVSTAAVGTVVRNNLIAGIEMTGFNHAAGMRFGTALSVSSTASGTIFTGNRVGVAANGVTPILNVVGFAAISDPTGVPNNTRFGGTPLGEGNLVANSEGSGVQVYSSATSVRITGNSIFGNGALGIDLMTLTGTPFGQSPNDATDADVGGNQLQNYPVLTMATTTGKHTTITGTLQSLANRVFVVEFFANSGCDLSGFGEGQTFLGFTSVTTDASGAASFVSKLAVATVAGAVVTATATEDATGNTSEYSACLVVSSSVASPADIDGSGSVDARDLALLLSAWGSTNAAADLNDSGVVDAMDLAILMDAWSV